ncbi:MAG: hypothetical protein J6S67_02125 [Methanobrevibacter sp.]|nr:hypothetical protein [Methanobrevibacter sp.]
MNDIYAASIDSSLKIISEELGYLHDIADEIDNLNQTLDDVSNKLEYINNSIDDIKKEMENEQISQ